MKKRLGLRFIIALLITTLFASCERKHTWQVVASGLPEGLLSISGRAANDVFAVGADKDPTRGPLVLHYDGKEWMRLPTGVHGTLWWVHAFKDGPVFMAGANANILKYVDGRFTRMQTPGVAKHTVFGMWGNSENDLYAVGSVNGFNGFVWHYDGTAWSNLEIPLANLPGVGDGPKKGDWPGFFKVWGTPTGAAKKEVWVVGGKGLILKKEGDGAFEIVPSMTEQTLFTVHGNTNERVFVGGGNEGVLLHQIGDRLRNGSPGSERAGQAPLLQGVYRTEGIGVATGQGGVVYRYRDNAWRLDVDAPSLSIQSLHAAWIDPSGWIWSVGGDVTSPELDNGAIIRFGPPIAPVNQDPLDAGVDAEDVPTPPTVECPMNEKEVSVDKNVARQWNDVVLNSIRRDIPYPGVHARNLFHLSAAMYDAWAAYDAEAEGVFYASKHTSADASAARREAISYAAYRVASYRYNLAKGAAISKACFDHRLTALDYDPTNISTEGDSPSAVGNRIGQLIIDSNMNDGANELGMPSYSDTTGYVHLNPPLVTDDPGTVLNDPSKWQPINLAVAETQNGISVPSGVQSYLGAQWGKVRPFMKAQSDALYFDPGAPPVFDDSIKADVVEIIQKEAWLDPKDDTMMDISPGAYGNNTLGTNDGHGHAINPVASMPYAPQMVKRSDFGRVLAEFWADGPKSETPPGHWNALANDVMDDPGFAWRWRGVGDALDPLEYSVKLYLALDGALHNAAISAWQIKRQSLGVRPISLVRYMGQLGQSSNMSLPSYHAMGLPLVPGTIELITRESIQAGQRHAHLSRYLGQVAVRGWNGEPGDRVHDVGGVAWIRAVEWIPYQRRTFVTPAFPGFVSGHSTFSRAGAEVLALVTGSAFFPNGIFTYTLKRNEYLVFEDGPSTDVLLQNATYYDAADQAGQSRVWGGIHISADDFPGRRIGREIGLEAVGFAEGKF